MAQPAVRPVDRLGRRLAILFLPVLLAVFSPIVVVPAVAAPVPCAAVPLSGTPASCNSPGGAQHFFHFCLGPAAFSSP